jgi:hypothetical protein
MSMVLVLGCGDLAWGRPSKSNRFGQQWSHGHVPSELHPTPEGPRPAAPDALDGVRLADEIEGLFAWSPTRALFGPPPKVEVVSGDRPEGPLLPSWSDFVVFQARWATRTLDGPGVLVTPGDWLASGKGRSLLEVWAGEGWSWAPLEVALRGKYLPLDRIASSSGLWLRLTDEGGSLVCANGPEAARAVEVVPLALEAAVQALGGREAMEWWREEEPQTGWYARQRIRRGILAALKQGRTRVELGAQASLFGFSSAEALQRFVGLAGVRISMDLEPVTVPWWEWIAEPGFLGSPAGGPHTGIRWRERKTVLLESEGTRQLANHLAYKGMPREEVDPAGFEEALGAGGALPAPPPDPKSPEEALFISSVEGSGDVGSLPDEIEEIPPPPPPPLLTALADYRPDQFSLGVLHSHERLRVLIDGEQIGQENVRYSVGDGSYTIAGRAVAHGSIVRIDYEPVKDPA